MTAPTHVCIASILLAAMSGCAREDQPSAEYPADTIGTAQEDVSPAAERELSGVAADADHLLQRMSDYLESLRAFTFDANHTTEVVLDSGQKLAFSANSHVSVRRPNKLRSDRRGEMADLSFFYDGRTVTVLGRRANAFAQASAPANLNDMIDFTRDKLELDAPAADLLYTDVHSALMEDAVAGMRVGRAVVHGVRCHHLAYRGHNVDWQLWIEDGPRPLPHKYVITTKDVKSFPQFTVEMHNWNTSANLPDELFQFAPPPDARRVEFLALAEERRKTSAR